MESIKLNYIQALLFALMILIIALGTLSGASGTASIAGLLLILLQLKLLGWPTNLVKTLLFAFVAGGAWEAMAVHQEWIQYTGTHGYHALPWWMLIFWMGLAVLLEGPLAGLRNYSFRSLLLGSCSGPLFAMAGEEMGLLVLPDPAISLPRIAMGWAVIFAFLSLLGRQNPSATIAERP
jgi:Protein of unknown function (DUF2878)